jgi:hypothetical protein
MWPWQRRTARRLDSGVQVTLHDQCAGGMDRRAAELGAYAPRIIVIDGVRGDAR